jgi:hypothetical protein
MAERKGEAQFQVRYIYAGLNTKGLTKRRASVQLASDSDTDKKQGCNINRRDCSYEKDLSHYHQESRLLEILTHPVRVCDIPPHGSATKSTNVRGWIVLKVVSKQAKFVGIN